MATLQDYEKHYHETHSNEPLSEEWHICFTWLSEKAPQLSVEKGFLRAAQFLCDIRSYVLAAQKQVPPLAMDIHNFDIYDCLRKSASITLEEGLQLVPLIRRYAKTYSSLDRVDEDMLAILGYLARTAHHLTPAEALKKAEKLKMRLIPYIEAAKALPYHQCWTVDVVAAYDVILKTHADLSLKEAAQWVKNVTGSTSYEHITEDLPTSYPVGYLSLSTFTDGKACLKVWFKTLYGEPFLKQLAQCPDTWWSDRGCFISFNTHGKEALPDRIAEKMHRFFAELSIALQQVEITFYKLGLPIQEDAVLLEKINTYKEQCIKKINDFASIKKPAMFKQHVLRSQPNTQSTMRTDSLEGRRLDRIIQHRDIKSLEVALSNFADPNLIQWNMPLLSRVVSGVQAIKINFLCGEPTQEQLEVLNKPYTLIIAHHNQQYYLYQMDLKKPSMKTILQSALVSLLTTLQEKIFKPDGRLRSSSLAITISEQLIVMLWPYVGNDLEQQRRVEAQTLLQIAQLLMAYGADPGVRVDEAHPGNFTFIENILHTASGARNDPINQDLWRDFVKLTLQADKQHSHLVVAESYRRHFLGGLILQGLNTLYAKEALRPSIANVTLTMRAKKLSVAVTNRDGNSLYLQTLRREEIEPNSKMAINIIALFMATFEKLTNMSKDELKKYIKKKLLPGKGISFIDLLYDKEKSSIVAFNIADVVPPSSRKEPVLHYLPLAVCAKPTRDAYKNLMTIVSYHRILLLERYYNTRVLTIYTAASAMSYLQTASLPAQYPKYNCLSTQDKQLIKANFFQGRQEVPGHDNSYFKSDMFYDEPTRDEKFPTLTTINCDIYNGYNLRLMSKLPSGTKDQAKQRVIYLDECSNKCILRGLGGEVYEFILPKEIDLSDLQDKLENADFKKSILEFTAKKGYTPYNRQLALEGHSTLVVIDSRKANMDALARRVQPHLQHPYTFFSIAFTAASLTQRVLNTPVTEQPKTPSKIAKL